jgi:hypothetical protein
MGCDVRNDLGCLVMGCDVCSIHATSNTEGRAKAWCLLTHAEASLSISATSNIECGDLAAYPLKGEERLPDGEEAEVQREEGAPQPGSYTRSRLSST